MKASPRPSAVTMACVFVGISSFLMLMQLMGALTSWGTIEMQKALEPTLTTLQERGFDVTMIELLAALRWVGLSSVVLLVAGMVFAAYAVRGDHVSRIGATVTAVVLALLVVPFGLVGILQAVFLLFAAGTLWAPDARGWYATRRHPDGDQPAPADPWAAPTPGAQTQTTETVKTIEAPAPPLSTTKRPNAVLAAGLVTVLGSALAGGLSALYLVIYGLAREEYVRVLQDGPFADWYTAAELDQAMQFAFWGSLVMLPLAVAGLAAGLSLLARKRIGRVATLALAWITAAAGFVAIPLGLLGTAAAVAVIVLLNRDESRSWADGAH